MSGLLMGVTSCLDTFSEELKIWRFSETLSLLSFNFNFEIMADQLTL